MLGTFAIVLMFFTPTLLINEGRDSWAAWFVTAAAVLGAVGFCLREHSVRHLLINLKLFCRPLVPSSPAFKAATGLAVPCLRNLVT